jgi:hypothetical protein
LRIALGLRWRRRRKMTLTGDALFRISPASHLTHGIVFGGVALSTNVSAPLRRGALAKRGCFRDEGGGRAEGSERSRCEVGRGVPAEVRGAGWMPMPLGGGRIGTAGAPAPDGKPGRIDGPNRGAFSEGERFERSIEGQQTARIGPSRTGVWQEGVRCPQGRNGDVFRPRGETRLPRANVAADGGVAASEGCPGRIPIRTAIAPCAGSPAF